MFSRIEKISFVEDWKSEIGAELLIFHSHFSKDHNGEEKKLLIKKEVLEEWIKLSEFLNAYKE